MHTIAIAFNDVRPLWTAPSWLYEEIARALPPDWQLRRMDGPVDGRGDGSGLADEARAAVREAEVYMSYGFPRELLFEATSAPDAPLRWVHSGSAGVASLLYDEMRSSDIIITNSAGMHAPPMAETALGMLLYFARGFDLAAAGQQRAEWNYAPFIDKATPVREVAGATLGLVGYGGIGREVASRARTRHARRRHPKK